MARAVSSSARVVLLTQPGPRVTTIAVGLSRQGYDPLVLTFSTLETAPFVSEVTVARSHIFRTRDRRGGVDRAWDVVVFVSPSAVLAFQGEAQSSGLIDWPDAIAVATVGPGTLEALTAAGLPRSVRCLAPKRAPWDARSLLESIREEGVRPGRVLVVGGATSGTDWAAEFQPMGIPCDCLTAYRNQRCEPDRGTVERLHDLCTRHVAWVGVVTQAKTAEALNRMASDWPMTAQRWMRAQPFLSIHPRIEQSLIHAGFHSTQRILPGTTALDAALSSDLWSTPRQYP